MELLIERIKKEGRVLPGDILKIDSFLNHQVDTKLMSEIGKEFRKVFKDINPTKILTVEASGIPVAISTAPYFDYCPVIFAKKNRSYNSSSDVYASNEKSYTRGNMNSIQISKEYLSKDDKVLILDDFIAKGEACSALIDICRQAGCEILGVGSVVCKTYQGGIDKIREAGVDVRCLAYISSMDNGIINFE